MRRAVRRVQDLGQKAGQLRDVAASMPERAAEIRDAVLLTTEQLQQLRTDVEAGVAGLRADDEDRIARALRELNESAGTFREAGYELDGVDLEISPVQRLIVSLDKVADAGASRLRALRQASADKPTVRAVLDAMLKADETAARVHLPALDFSELIVHIGPVPSVRLCWRAPVDVAASETAHAATRTPAGGYSPAAPAVRSTPAPSTTELLGEGSFFARRGTSPAQDEGTSDAIAPRTPTPPAAVAPAAPAGPARRDGDTLRSALDRFKKMPDLGRRP